MAKENINFNNSSLILHNQDLEEAEELEERKRREEEVHNLLSHAMGQFNFDEQSTINSSITSNEGDNSIIHNNVSLKDQYRETSFNNQLKTLYEVRVREVEALSKEIDKLKKDFNEQQNMLKRQVTLLEAENQQKGLSLTESQTLLVEKTERHMKLTDELNALKNNIMNLESKIKELQEENEVLRQLNVELEKQIIITQKGFPLLSNKVDKEFQESQRLKIEQMERALQHAQEEARQSNQQHKKLQEELKRSMCDRENDMLEKNMFINKLSNENQQLRQQLLEHTKIIEEQKNKLELTSIKGQHLEEEIKKFQKRQMTEELREVIWKEATQEFQPQIENLNLENKKLKEELNVSITHVKDMQRYVEKMSSLEIENSNLGERLSKLQEKYDDVNSEMDILFKKLKECEEEKNSLQKQQSQLLADSELFKALKAENEDLQKKLVELQVNASLDERGIQTSLPFINNNEFMRVQEQLVTAHHKIAKLENHIKQLQEDNTKLQIKIGLEQERETLIKELQLKAAKFEKIIQHKQKHRSNDMVSVGVNTTPESDASLLKVQHDTLIYQTEAKLHKKLKKEFDEKLIKAITEYNALYQCKECPSLKDKIAKLTEMRQQDRDAVLNLITMWEKKFQQFEKDAEKEMLELFSAKVKSENNATQMKQLLEEYMEKYYKVQECVEKYNGNQFESHKQKIVTHNKENYTIILKHLNKITGKILHSNKEIRDTEKKFQDRAKLGKN